MKRNKKIVLKEAGVMMDVLQEMLEEVGVNVKFIAVDESNPETCFINL